MERVIQYFSSDIFFVYNLKVKSIRANSIERTVIPIKVVLNRLR